MTLHLLGWMIGCGGPAEPGRAPQRERGPGDGIEHPGGGDDRGQAEEDRWSGVDLRVCADGSGDFTDLQEGIDAAKRGEVVGACAGTYRAIRALWGQQLTVVGVDGPEQTFIDGEGYPAVLIEEGVLDLSGFTITGAGVYDPWYPLGAITVFEGELTLHDAIVERCSGPFTLLFDEDVMEVRDVRWRNNTSDWLWYLWQGDDDGDEPGGATLTRNVVTGGRHTTIVETSKLYSLDLRNNVFAQVTMDKGVSAFVFHRFQRGPLLVANNVFYDVDDLDPWGGRLFEGDPDLRNNVVLDCDAWDVVPLRGAYNLFWNNGVDYAPEITGEGNLFAEPGVADARGLDFRPDRGSPLIDAGDPAPAFTDPDGTRNDIGITGGPSRSVDGSSSSAAPGSPS